MSCLSRYPQAVRPVTSRIKQINRVVTRKTTQTNNNQNFTVCIFLFFYLLLHYF